MNLLHTLKIKLTQGEAVTQSYLKTLMEYNPVTGDFTRKINWGGSGKPGDVVGKSSTKSNTYKRVAIKGQTYYLHRLAFLYMEGVIPDEVDHKDRDRSNNKWENLINTTRIGNSKNKSKLSTNTSEHTGVVWIVDNSTWQAKITVEGKVLTQNFKTKAEAIEKRRQWEIDHNFYHQEEIDYIQIDVPVYYTQEFKTKASKTFLVGMNWMRVAHHYIQNKVKQDYSELITPQLLSSNFKITGQYEVAYKYYYKNKSSDLLNVGALMSKYFLDAAQKAGTVKEDNVQWCVRETFHVAEHDNDHPRMEIFLRAVKEEDEHRIN